MYPGYRSPLAVVLHFHVDRFIVLAIDNNTVSQSAQGEVARHRQIARLDSY